MALSINSWNVNPNRAWYVRLTSGILAVTVDLYLSEADASDSVNAQASGTTVGFGSDLDVVLTVSPVAIVPIYFFQDICLWHLKVSGLSNDEAKTFKVGPFSDADDITHSIYLNADIIDYRANYTIEQHTNLETTIEVGTSVLGVDIKCNEACRIISESLSLDRYCTIKSIEKNFGIDSMLMSTTLSCFEGLVR
jgi:hypothetical protein